VPGPRTGCRGNRLVRLQSSAWSPDRLRSRFGSFALCVFIFAPPSARCFIAAPLGIGRSLPRPSHTFIARLRHGVLSVPSATVVLTRLCITILGRATPAPVASHDAVLLQDSVQASCLRSPISLHQGPRRCTHRRRPAPEGTGVPPVVRGCRRRSGPQHVAARSLPASQSLPPVRVRVTLDACLGRSCFGIVALYAAEKVPRRSRPAAAASGPRSGLDSRVP